jgi:hypothetical protein
MNRAMSISVPVLFGVLMLAATVRAGTLVEFDGGISVIPVSRVSTGAAGDPAAGLPVSNIVHGVSPGGQPWVISRFRARVKDDGHITAEAKDLYLAGSNSIGTSTPVPNVVAALFCGSDVPHSSGPAPFEDGAFKINDTLSPLPPNPCPNPVLLIRANSSTGPWIAAGIPKE